MPKVFTIVLMLQNPLSFVNTSNKAGYYCFCKCIIISGNNDIFLCKNYLYTTWAAAASLWNNASDGPKKKGFMKIPPKLKIPDWTPLWPVSFHSRKERVLLCLKRRLSEHALQFLTGISLQTVFHHSTIAMPPACFLRLFYRNSWPIGIFGAFVFSRCCSSSNCFHCTVKILTTKITCQNFCLENDG